MAQRQLPTWLLCAAIAGAAAPVGWCDFYTALPFWVMANAAYGVVVVRLVRGAAAPGLGAALLAVLALRAVCLPHPPSYSDDVYRYLHEGAVVLAGHNPYEMAPADAPPALRGAYWERINNPEISAAYPPAVQCALAAGAWLSAEPIGMKLVFGACDVLVFVALWLALPWLSVPRHMALVWGLCPLMAFEFAGQAHSDSLAVLATVLGVFFGVRRRAVLAGIAIGIAAGAKLMPLALLPFALRGTVWWRGVVACAATVALLWAPFWTDPAQLLAGTEQYSRRWSGNATLFLPLLATGQWLEGIGWLRGFDHLWLREGQAIAKLPLAALTVGLLAACWWRRCSTPRTALWFFVFFVAFSPTVHPWYVSHLLPWLCVWPNPGLIAFSATVFFAYHVLPRWHVEGVWEPTWWWTAAEYLPFYVGVVWLLSRSWSSRGGMGAAPPRSAA